MLATRDDEATVTFPATSDFARIARVTAMGLGFRLGFDVGTIENLRLAVDFAVRRLLGDGKVTLEASWTDTQLDLALSNPAVDFSAGANDLLEEINDLVATASVANATILLGVG